MYFYLIMNAKLELKFLNKAITLKELDETFNQIAFSIANENDLFENDNESEVNFIFENHENINLKGINDKNLEIIDFINLLASILNTNNIDPNNQEEEEVSINHGDLDFDIDEMVNKFVFIRNIFKKFIFYIFIVLLLNKI